MSIEALIVKGYMADIFPNDDHPKPHRRKRDNSDISNYMTLVGVIALVAWILINFN
jgi:hypothetical protein